MFKRLYFVFILVALPVLAGAADLSQTDSLLKTADRIITRTVVPLVFVLALLFFFWGVAKYIKNEGQGKDDGKKIMVWGVVALFVASSIWGLVYFIRLELGINQINTVPIPSVTGTSGR